MAAKHDLKHSIINLVKQNQDGSFNTRAARKVRLLLTAEQLAASGYKIRHIRQLKHKHVKRLVNSWLQQELSAGTIKNRMTDLRWAMSKFGKSSIIPATNDALNIPRRHYVTNQDKSIKLSQDALSKITDPYVKLSLILQREFGLRREESIKIKIHQAVKGNELHLQGSWSKNGRPRIINIIYPEQFAAIEQVKKFITNKQSALIPDHKTYIQQQKTYDRQLHRAGISKAHGLRHAYAQKLYRDLTGWDCPAKGGSPQRALSKDQRRLDKLARESISRQLGHDRTNVVAIYCGS